MEPPAKKKQRTNQNAMDFCITISSPSSFKNMCDVMDSILPYFHFQVVQNQHFQGLKIRQMDESHCALLSIRYTCQVTLSDEVQRQTQLPKANEGVVAELMALFQQDEKKAQDTYPLDKYPAEWLWVKSKGGDILSSVVKESLPDVPKLSFCVNKKTWRQFMKQINTTAVLKICRYVGEDSVTILCNDDEHSGRHKYTSNTLDVDLDNVGEAEEIKCDTPIQVDLEECKKFWRLCSSQDCEEVRFRFLVPPFENLKDGVFHMQFQNQAIKQVSGSRMFHSNFVDDKFIADFKSTVNEEEDYANWRETYNQEFPVKLLNTFTKNLEKEQRLSIGMAQDKPLIINYNLGIEKSHIRFYIAPKCEE